MSAPLVFMDTETTGLAIDDDIWEFAAVRRDPDGTETEFHCFVEHDRAKCSRLPASFRQDHESRYLDHRAVSRKQACNIIADAFRGEGKPHVVGAVPNFDTERISRMIGACWPHWPAMNWHHHLIDIETLAVGALFGGYVANQKFSVARAFMSQDPATLALPWDSNTLSRQIGVDPDPFERHTAMGDVRWAMAIYDTVTGKR